MYTTNLETFKTQEKELHHQATQYRLASTLEQKKSLISRIYGSLGQMLVLSGQQLINHSRAEAH
ncbi:MAG: hypothetical protein KAH12_00590 [Anaerolineales bacterium]|nr:hypothetical protein [Anaerolineales bacterium]